MKPSHPARSLWRVAGWLLCGLLGSLACVAAQAKPRDLQGRWTAPDADEGRHAVERIAPTGGAFRFEAELPLSQAGTYVIDFKNSSVIGRFEHRVYDADGSLVAQLEGGIASGAANPFFLRHGRELNLPPGHYRLVTDVASPFYLAQPEPYLDTLDDYRLAVRSGDALVLFCMGVFAGLGLYYTSLALIRRQRVHAMYAVFILGNLLYNATALLVLHDLVASGWFYLISLPILLSNIAYVVFVVALLGITPHSAPRLYRLSRGVLALLGTFAVLGLLRPHWSLELDRYGVAVFLLFGLAAGVNGVLRGNVLARLYMLANIGFVATGLAAISMAHLQGVYSIYVEHVGLVAVAIEVLLLALVLSYQFGLLQREKDVALEHAEANLRLACTDALTGMPNRYALEIELAHMPQRASLTFVDLDGLKQYNDTHGHASGDSLLREFAREFSARLDGLATLHRVGGDEFAVTCRDGEVAAIEQLLAESVRALRDAGYEFGGASCGSVRVFETTHRDDLKHVADIRMYENKRQRSARATFETGTT